VRKKWDGKRTHEIMFNFDLFYMRCEKNEKMEHGALEIQDGAHSNEFESDQRKAKPTNRADH
jgi:hypothetical protein